MKSKEDSFSLIDCDNVTGFVVETDHVIIYTSKEISDKEKKEIQEQLNCSVKFCLRD